jgi:hypothetical protein
MQIGPNSDETAKLLPISAELNVRIHSAPAKSYRRAVLIEAEPVAVAGKTVRPPRPRTGISNPLPSSGERTFSS